MAPGSRVRMQLVAPLSGKTTGRVYHAGRDIRMRRWPRRMAASHRPLDSRHSGRGSYNPPMTTADPRWRLILSQPDDGAANMATDEAILESVTAGAEPPTLRLYAWEPACLSIGYAQPIGEADEDRLAQRGWALVRRPTGGRAILHTDELTYAVVAPASNTHVDGGVLASYRHLSQGLIFGLQELGLDPEVRDDDPVPEDQRADPVCFEVPSAYEITFQGMKLIGSAQLRRQGGVLQHGSLPLTGDIGRICLALRFPDELTRRARMDRLRERAATVADLLGREVPWRAAADALRRGFSERLGIHFDEEKLSPAETRRAEQLASDRYGQAEWNHRV
jgi:lipoate-protein ligase A